jgi:hypothetical protein
MRLNGRVATAKSGRWSAWVIGGTRWARKSYAGGVDGRGREVSFLMKLIKRPHGWRPLERWRRWEIRWDSRRRAVAKAALRPLPKMRPNRRGSSSYKMIKGKGLRRGTGVEVSFSTVSPKCGIRIRNRSQAVSAGARDHILSGELETDLAGERMVGV